MKRIIQFLPIIIVLSCLIISCSDDEPLEKEDDGPFNIQVVNESCTSWNITENSNNIVTVSPDNSTSFTANKGQHTYNFTPQPEKCGYPLVYEYGSGDLTLNVNHDNKFTISSFGLILYTM